MRSGASGPAADFQMSLGSFEFTVKRGTGNLYKGTIFSVGRIANQWVLHDIGWTTTFDLNRGLPKAPAVR